MKKGISPVIAVVLLIAIAVIAAVGVWYWVGGLATKPAGLDQAQQAFTIENCDLETDELLVRNTGGVMLNVDASVYNEANEEIGTLNLTELGAGDVEWRDTTADLEPNHIYTVLEGGLPTIQFTC